MKRYGICIVLVLMALSVAAGAYGLNAGNLWVAAASVVVGAGSMFFVAFTPCRWWV